jgi:DnaJ-class molecular chaperone with C-terminal Zn finger domain
MDVNEAGRGNRRFFAIASLGRTRWYWVVWPSLGELQASNEPLIHIAEGYGKTKAEAVEKALEIAGRFAEWIAAKYAKTYHHNTKAGTTPERDSSHIAESPLVMHEFLYRDIYDAATKQWDSVPHRVVRRTRKYVYVEQHSYSSDNLTGGWLDAERPTYRLDRQVLEQEGYAFIPASSYLSDKEEPLFFNHERGKRYSGRLPTCLEVLHLSWPCTVADVQEAYRRLVKSAHPDGGGSHSKFLELQAAYEQALRICR